jgi:hypothetical protein
MRTFANECLVGLAGCAFPDGVTLGNLKQRWIRFAWLEFGDFVSAFTRAGIFDDCQKWDLVLSGHPVFRGNGERPVVSLITRRYDPCGARAFGLDAGDGAETKVLSSLLLSRASDLRLRSRINFRNFQSWYVRDIRNPRAVVPADTCAGNRIEDMVSDPVDRLAIGTDVQGVLLFGISAAFRIASLFDGKGAGDGGFVGECLHNCGGAVESPRKVIHRWTPDVRNLTGVASHRLSQKGDGCD